MSHPPVMTIVSDFPDHRSSLTMLNPFILETAYRKCFLFSEIRDDYQLSILLKE